MGKVAALSYKITVTFEDWQYVIYYGNLFYEQFRTSIVHADGSVTYLNDAYVRSIDVEIAKGEGK